MTGAITLAGDLVLAGGGNGDYVFSAREPAGVVVPIDRQTGRIHWQTAVGDSVLGPIANRDGVAVAASRTGKVTALNASDGSVLWRQSLTGETRLAGPAFTGRYVFATSCESYLGAIDSSDGGRLLRRVYLNDPGHPGEMS